MDQNSIDIKIREFAIYLKEFGLLNETNIKDFLNTFKNLKGKDLRESTNFDNDINLELIYLKENLAKAILQFFNLMTEETKRITYLNIYSKFLQKREKDLKDKGSIIFKLYSSLIIKKFFSFWKSLIPHDDIKNNKKRNNSVSESNNYKNLKIDNFCFDVIDNNNIKNNITINSNNNKILFDSNITSKSEMRSTVNSFTDFNSLILSTKTNLFNNNNNNNMLLNSNNSKNKKSRDRKKSQKFNNNIKINYKQNNIIFENYEQQNKEQKEEIKKQNQRNIKTPTLKNSNSNIAEKNKFTTINNDKDSKKKSKRNFIKLLKNDKESIYEDNTQTIRKTYNSNRPLSNFSYDEYNKKNVYKRLYEQNIEYNKRREQRIEENLKEIRERSNHPIIKSNSIHKLRNLKKSFGTKEKIKQNIIKNRNKINILDNQKNIKSAFNNMDKNIIFEKEYKYTAFDKRYNKEKEEKLKIKPNINEYKNKFIDLYNEIIKKEENIIGKKYSESEKEKMFKELLSKIYQEKHPYQNSDNYSNEFSKTAEGI